MRMIPLSDGTELATWTRGTTGSLPPVVLVHGGPGLWDDLRDLSALLEDQTLVHRYDQRGCGRSAPRPVPADQFSIERFVADLEELRTALHAEHDGHERWIVLGHSFGADLALAYAAAYPEHVAAAGCLSGTGIGDWRTPTRAEHERRRREVGVGEEFAALDRLGEEGRTPEQETRWRTLQWATDFADPTAGLAHAARLAAAPLTIEHTANRALAADPAVGDEALIQDLSRIDAPVWFVHGTQDPRPVAGVVDLAAHARRGRKRIIEGAGHFPWVERPERTREVLEEIVRSGA
ncbi:alpha/beta hydrolase [Brachybacterium endophyticum]|uniref:Alpha/beta hydrolase n=1 Tax=Brachybacterium endophyticum TaxID=2182385 RepID=A0A2U2RJL6_9MICO|nr:alpha/beta hydrolase [Brachybacterium endophyticum]PWH06072.1 alpha/beta hydrolase [Brachybacterium endophyticum]